MTSVSKESPKRNHSGLATQSGLLILRPVHHRRAVDTRGCDFGVLLRGRIGELEDQDIVGILVGLAVPLLSRALRAGRLRHLLEHVLAGVEDVAGGSVLDGLQGGGIDGLPVRDGQGIAFDGLERSPDRVGGVALGLLGALVLGVQGFLRRGRDVLAAVTRRPLQASQGVVAVGESRGLETGV